MMKKSLFIAMLLTMGATANAQVVSRVIPARFDKVEKAKGIGLFLCKQGNTTYIWTRERRQLGQSQDNVASFSERKAVTITPGTDIVTGFFNLETGKYEKLPGYRIALNHPYFHDGNLLVKDKKDLVYVSSDGSVRIKATEGLPFRNGYAVCNAYAASQKPKDATYGYRTTGGDPVTISLNGEVVSGGDIDFLSSLNPEGTSIVIVKRKVYLFSKSNGQLRPLTANDGGSQVTIDGGLGSVSQKVGDSLFVIKANVDKSPVRLTFDRFHVPLSIAFADNTINYPRFGDGSEPTDPGLEIINGHGHQGLKYKGELLLPIQFEALELTDDNYMYVNEDGKWGALYFDPDEKFNIILNHGNDIPFRHAAYDTNVRIEMPASVPAERTQLHSSEKAKMEVDLTSVQTKTTSNGNVAEFKCTLGIPDELPDYPVEVVYPFEVFYDNIVSAPIPVTVKGWHVKYHEVKFSDIKIEQGGVDFNINITEKREQGESTYPFEVKVDAGKAEPVLTKVSETLYKCRVPNLREGKNAFDVLITEKGCPPSTFPFNITYSKQKPAAAGGAAKSSGSGAKKPVASSGTGQVQIHQSETPKTARKSRIVL